MNTTQAATTAALVNQELTKTITTRVIVNISAFNPAAPSVDVMVCNAAGALVHSKSYPAADGAESIAAAVLAAL